MKNFPSLTISNLNANTVDAAYLIISGVGNRADYADRVSFSDFREWVSGTISTSISETDLLGYLTDANRQMRFAGQAISLSGTAFKTISQGARSTLDLNGATITTGFTSNSSDTPVFGLHHVTGGTILVPTGIVSNLIVGDTTDNARFTDLTIASADQQIGGFAVSVDHNNARLRGLRITNFGNGIRLTGDTVVVEDCQVTGYIRGIVARKKDANGNNLEPGSNYTFRNCRISGLAAGAPPKTDHASISGNDGIGGGGYDNLVITGCRVSDAQEHNIYVPADYGLSVTAWANFSGTSILTLTANNPIKPSNPALINKLLVGDVVTVAGASPTTFNSTFTIMSIDKTNMTVTLATPGLVGTPTKGGWLDQRPDGFMISDCVLLRSTNTGLKLRHRTNGGISNIQVINAAYNTNHHGNDDGFQIVNTKNVTMSGCSVRSADGEPHSAYVGLHLTGNESLTVSSTHVDNATYGIQLAETYLKNAEDSDDDGSPDTGTPFDDRPPQPSANVAITARLTNITKSAVYFDHYNLAIGNHDLDLHINGCQTPIDFAAGSNNSDVWFGINTIQTGCRIKITGTFENNTNAQVFPNNAQIDMSGFGPAALMANTSVGGSSSIAASNIVGQYGLINITSGIGNLTDLGNGAAGHFRYREQDIQQYHAVGIELCLPKQCHTNDPRSHRHGADALRRWQSLAADRRC